MLKFFRWLAFSLIFLVFIVVCSIVGLYLYVNKGLPKLSSIKDYRPFAVTRVYAYDFGNKEKKIGEFYRERRIVIPYSEIPNILVYAFIAAEDARFFQHQGIDMLSIMRAFVKNIKAGAIIQGGSTITQQLAKSLFLNPERSYTRKMKEAILAYRLESSFTKKDILYMYLNQIYLGHGAYGVEAASQNYFGKSAKELNIAQCALLAGLPQAPSRDSPIRYPRRARQRQIYVLNRMADEGFISRREANDAMRSDFGIIPVKRNWYIEQVPVYTENVRREVEKKYGADLLYTGGLKIYTAVDIAMQKTARQHIKKGLMELDKRQGYRGPLQHLAPEQIEDFLRQIEEQEIEGKNHVLDDDHLQGVVIGVDDQQKDVTVRIGSEIGKIKLEDMKWARPPDPKLGYGVYRINRPSQVLSVGDVIQVKIQGEDEEGIIELSLEQTPEAQAALLCIESKTGYVKAMIGGRDFTESQFNRAIQSRRQPGSAFKPIIYAAAIDKGYTPATVIYDSALVFEDTERDFTWKPKNYGETFHGPTLLREAMEQSRNVVTIKLLEDIGIDYAIEYARKLGIESHISNNLSIALGSSGLSLLEIAQAYSVFMNEGYFIKPIFITKIEDRDGNILEEADTSKEKVIDETTAYIMTSLLEGVVKSGTGWRIKELDRPVAGKTGTTNNLYDAWFLGYTPDYVTGVWVGFDDEKSLGVGETGSRAASPIWLGFMKEALKEKPIVGFNVPEGIVFSKIDADTGLLPIPESKHIIFECFKEGTVPTEFTKRPDIISEPDDLFKRGL